MLIRRISTAGVTAAVAGLLIASPTHAGPQDDPSVPPGGVAISPESLYDEGGTGKATRHADEGRILGWSTGARAGAAGDQGRGRGRGVSRTLLRLAAGRMRQMTPVRLREPDPRLFSPNVVGVERVWRRMRRSGRATIRPPVSLWSIRATVR